jgi:hypothetical protein
VLFYDGVCVEKYDDVSVHVRKEEKEGEGERKGAKEEKKKY